MALRIYVAYDREVDRDIYAQLVESSARQGMFAVAAHSEKGLQSPGWLQQTEERIGSADQIVIICGETTDESEELAHEFRIARELKKPFVLLWSRREAMCKKPAGAGPNDNIFSWTDEVLREQLTLNQRQGLKEKVPKEMKRQPPSAPKDASAQKAAPAPKEG